MSRPPRPTGVTVLAVLAILSGVQFAVGVAMLVSAVGFVRGLGPVPFPWPIALAGAALAIACFVHAAALLAGHAWARWVVVVESAALALVAGAAAVLGPRPLLAGYAVAGLLLVAYCFRSEVRLFFAPGEARFEVVAP